MVNEINRDMVAETATRTNMMEFGAGIGALVTGINNANMDASLQLIKVITDELCDKKMLQNISGDGRYNKVWELVKDEDALFTDGYDTTASGDISGNISGGAKASSDVQIIYSPIMLNFQVGDEREVAMGDGSGKSMTYVNIPLIACVPLGLVHTSEFIVNGSFHIEKTASIDSTRSELGSFNSERKNSFDGQGIFKSKHSTLLYGTLIENDPSRSNAPNADHDVITSTETQTSAADYSAASANNYRAAAKSTVHFKLVGKNQSTLSGLSYLLSQLQLQPGAEQERLTFTDHADDDKLEQEIDVPSQFANGSGAPNVTDMDYAAKLASESDTISGQSDDADENLSSDPVVEEPSA